jgi:hypothetical protein
MSVPILLPYGYVAVYGLGTDAGQTGLTTGDTINKFATIYYIGVGMNSGLIGNSIIFNSTQEVCRLSWDNILYPVIASDKIIGTENFL